MITGLAREDFEDKAREFVSDLLRQPRSQGVGQRLPLVILIEACAAKIAEMAHAGESADILHERLKPFVTRAFRRGFEAANARRPHNEFDWVPLCEVVG